jgi:hypothetical protein
MKSWASVAGATYTFTKLENKRPINNLNLDALGLLEGIPTLFVLRGLPGSG